MRVPGLAGDDEAWPEEIRGEREEQLQQLRDDPALEVEDCTFPLAEATSEPEA